MLKKQLCLYHSVCKENKATTYKRSGKSLWWRISYLSMYLNMVDLITIEFDLDRYPFSFRSR